jgi:parvulin-like peptidyl-prolyl isomerase
MRIPPYVLLAILLVLGLLLSGCGDRPSSPSADSPIETTEAPEQAPEEATTEIPEGEIVAYVNGRPAARSDFEAAKGTLLNQYLQMYAQFGLNIETLLAGAEGRMFQLSLEAEALSRVMAAILVEEEADRRGIRPSDEAVQAGFDAQYAEFLEGQGWTEEEFFAYLDEQGSSFEAFKETGLDTVDWQLTLDAVQRAVAGPVELSDEELATYFADHEADYAQPEQVMASHILVATKEEAIELHLQLSEGADFAELARERSIDPGSGSQGGDLGWFGRGMMVAPFEDAAFALEIGELSDIVESEFGFHIILLTDRQEAFEPELSDVIDQVRADLEDEILGERMQTWFNGIYDAAEFDILLPLLNAMWAQREDIDLGIEAFERIRADGSVDEPYLPYMIATLYETKLSDARAEKAALESDAADTPEIAAEIEAVDARIAEYRDKALAEYRLALEAVGEDPSIVSKIEELGGQAGEAENGDESGDAPEEEASE